jgi:NADPH-dependent 2,4-dienoyl-CoA reductase/sulfur reductase-like enzyme
MLLADALVERGHRVTLATSCLHVGEDEGITTLYPLLRLLGQQGVDLRERVRVTGFDGTKGGLVNQWDGRESAVDDIAAIVHWSGATPASALAAPLRDAGLDVHVIGDARLARRVDDAVREAAELAWSLAGPTAAAPSAD